MGIKAAFTFLVHPGKRPEEQKDIGGTELELAGKLGDLLSKQFEKSTQECNVEISFSPTKDGEQFNECRSDILEFLKSPSLDKAKLIAIRLQKVTTNRSKLGLLFLVMGESEGKFRVYISRYPADFGIIADEKSKGLRVELLEKVFMKSAHSYKAAVYEDTSLCGFWKGKAIDRQINHNDVDISGYWIREFLQSDFLTTSITGTRRLAIAMKEVIDNVNDLDIKQEISAAATLARNLNKQAITIENFGNRLGLSQKSIDALQEYLKSPGLKFDKFYFSAQEFSKHCRFRSVSIDNGAMLTAPAGDFDKCFTKKPVPGNNLRVEFTTQGKVVNERLKADAR